MKAFTSVQLAMKLASMCLVPRDSPCNVFVSLFDSNDHSSIINKFCIDGAKITGGQRFVYNVTVGTKVPIECDARGQPPPKIELFIGNFSVKQFFPFILFD